MALMRAVVIAFAASVGLVLGAGAAFADPGGNGNGDGPPPHAGSGNPHAPGETGNPHEPGENGNPHEGSPPYGQANGHDRGSSTGSSSGSTGPTLSAVPAAPGGNPGPPAETPGNPDRPLPKVTICHRTNSETNPFVRITISQAALDAHLRHGDVYPLADGGCSNDTALVEDGGGPAPGSGTAGDTGGGGDSGTLGEASGGAAEQASDPDGSGTLPFTGFAAMTLACIGILLACGGLVVRALEGGPRSQES